MNKVLTIIKQYKLLILILILAAILRFWDLSNNPPGLTWDEASLGVNTLSIFQTGTDEYGNFLPLNLKSFGDYKPALYVYLDAPMVGIFGLNEFNVRFPSVFFGLLTVLLLYFLTLELFKNKWLALLASFTIAISPWHIQFARPAFEANIALFFNILGVYLFIKGLKNKNFFIISAAIFGLSLLTYQASRLFVPLLILGLIFIYRKSLDIKNLKIPIIIFAFFLSLIIYTFIIGQTSRLATVNFFAYQRSEEQIGQILKEDNQKNIDFKFQILHGEWFAYVRGLFERYLIYFSPQTLFVEGVYEQRHRVPDLGILYYFSVVLIPLGIIYLVKNWNNSSRLVLTWLLISPLPGVLSRDLISILRAFNMVIPVVMLEAAGLYYLFKLIKNLHKYLKYLFYFLIIFVIFVNFIIYLDRYFVHAPIEYSKYWLYGYKQIYEKLNTLSKNYDQIIVTDVYGQPYIYYLFYTKYPLDKFRKQANLDQQSVDVGTVRKIDNIEFRHIYWPADRHLKNVLFIGSFDELPDKDIIPFNEAKILQNIFFLNSESALRMVKTNE